MSRHLHFYITLNIFVQLRHSIRPCQIFLWPIFSVIVKHCMKVEYKYDNVISALVEYQTKTLEYGRYR